VRKLRREETPFWKNENRIFPSSRKDHNRISPALNCLSKGIVNPIYQGVRSKRINKLFFAVAIIPGIRNE
jgi:hypothetical protein